MKKMEAIRWEKLEGEGQEPTIKHFNPSQYKTISLFLPSRLSFCPLLSVSRSLSSPLFSSLSLSLSLSLPLPLPLLCCVMCYFPDETQHSLCCRFIRSTLKVGRGEREV